MKKKRLLTLMALAVMALHCYSQTMRLTADPYPWTDETKTTVDMEASGEDNLWVKELELPNTGTKELSYKYQVDYIGANGETVLKAAAGSAYVIVPKNSSKTVTFYATINSTLDRVLSSHNGLSVGITDVNTRLLAQLPAATTDNSVSAYMNIRGAISLKSYTDATNNPTINCSPMKSQINNTLMSYNGVTGVGALSSAGFTAGVYQVTYDYKSCVANISKVNSYTLHVGDALAATVCFPCDATIPSGVKAWTLKYEGGVLNATSVKTTILANTPVLINVDKEGDYTFDFSGDYSYSFTENPSDATKENYINDVTSADNNLIGVMQPHLIPEYNAGTNPYYYYVLQNNANGLGFYKVNNKWYIIKQFRAYLKIPYDAGEARALTIVYDDENTTGVKNVKNTMAEGSNEIYNLSGQRVGKDYKGVVIKNGRKMIQK